jgi:hypothetical protein
MANKLNLDQSQRVDVVCRKNDTFALKLQISDENGVAVALGGTGDDAYDFAMEVREADTDDSTSPSNLSKMSTEFTAGTAGNITIDDTGYASGEVIFTCAHGDMDVDSGLYVYDIQQKKGTSSTIVETILYGTFQINEDVTITA